MLLGSEKIHYTYNYISNYKRAKFAKIENLPLVEQG